MQASNSTPNSNLSGARLTDTDAHRNIGYLVSNAYSGSDHYSKTHSYKNAQANRDAQTHFNAQRLVLLQQG